MNPLRYLIFSALLFSPAILRADLLVTHTRCLIPVEVNNGSGKILQQQYAVATHTAHALAMQYRGMQNSPEFKEMMAGVEKVNAGIPSPATAEQIQAAEDQFTKLLTGKSQDVLEAWKAQLLAGSFPEATDIYRSLEGAFLRATKTIQEGLDDKTMYSSGSDPHAQVLAMIHDNEVFVSKLKATQSAAMSFTHFSSELDDSCPGIPGITFEVEKNEKPYVFNDCLPVPGTHSAPYKTDFACSYSVACESVTIAEAQIPGADSVMFGVSCDKAAGSCPDLIACAKQSESTVGEPAAKPGALAAPAK